MQSAKCEYCNATMTNNQVSVHQEQILLQEHSTTNVHIKVCNAYKPITAVYKCVRAHVCVCLSLCLSVCVSS